MVRGRVREVSVWCGKGARFAQMLHELKTCRQGCISGISSATLAIPDSFKVKSTHITLSKGGPGFAQGAASVLLGIDLCFTINNGVRFVRAEFTRGTERHKTFEK